LERQEERLFGAPKAQVIKGYTALAQDVLNLEIGPDTKDSWRVVQMVNEMVKHHKERYAVNQDLNTTINSIRQDRVDAAAGKKNFLSRKDIGGGRTQYEHEKSDEEQAQTNLRIDKKMLIYGAEVASQAFALASGPEMDATVLSAQAGNLSFSKGIYRVADKFGLKPTEVFNEQQKARMLVTGEKFQLIKPSIGQKVIDDVLTPSMRILLKKTEEFDNNSMRKRVTAQATAGMDNGQMLRNSRRASMSMGADTNEFINMAAASGAKFPELVAAQMILESAGGTALSGTNNFFGIKATAAESSTAKQTTEFRNGVEGIETANFKNYSSPQESVNDLVSKWYKDYPGYQGVNNANSLEEAAMMLQQQGYATDPKYAQKLIQIANRFR